MRRGAGRRDRQRSRSYSAWCGARGVSRPVTTVTTTTPISVHSSRAMARGRAPSGTSIEGMTIIAAVIPSMLVPEAPCPGHGAAEYTLIEGRRCDGDSLAGPPRTARSATLPVERPAARRAPSSRTAYGGNSYRKSADHQPDQRNRNMMSTMGRTIPFAAATKPGRKQRLLDR